MGIRSLRFISVIPSQPIRLAVVYIPLPLPPRRTVVFDSSLLMCCSSTVNLSQFVSTFNLVNLRSYNVFMHLSQLQIQIYFFIHVVLSVYIFAFHSPAHEFRVFVSSLLSFNARRTHEMGQPQQSALRGPTYCVKSSINHTVIALVTLNSQRSRRSNGE
jgi:hypothetical protein